MVPLEKNQVLVTRYQADAIMFVQVFWLVGSTSQFKCILKTQELAKKHFLEAFASKAALPQEQLTAFDLGIPCVQSFHQICLDILFQGLKHSQPGPPGGAVASPCGGRSVAQQ